jgi:hypothetical protein
MPRLGLGILLGLAAGALAVLLMLPMKFPDKRAALLAAFFSRFAIGLLAANVTLPVGATASGALVGLLVSFPEAIVTRAYVPAVLLGILFGALAGWAGKAWGA